MGHPLAQQDLTLLLNATSSISPESALAIQSGFFSLELTGLFSLQALPKHLGLQKYLKVSHSRSFRRLCGNIRATERQISDQRALGEEALPPWMFGFQCNERYLAWDSSAQIQLLKIHAARELGRVRQALPSVCIMAPQKCGALDKVLSGSHDLVQITLLFGAGIVQNMSHSTT